MRVPAIVVVLVAILAGRALADDREEARVQFAAGQAADKTKDWQGAIEHYLRANDLVQHPFTTYNIAVDYERLDKFREAAKWYAKYLELAPDSPDRQKVEDTLGDLKSRPAPLSVRTIPDGARVLVDGRPVGTTPYSTKYRGGVHHIAVDHEGQHDERDVELEYGEPADVQFMLAGGTGGTISVSGTPAGAYVAVDNITIGVIPATAVVAPGPHTVRVSAYGFNTYESRALVPAGDTARVDVSLVRTIGSIEPPGPSLPFGWIFGASGGVDTSTSDPIALGALGVRYNQYEVVARLGYEAKGTAFDALLRWALIKTVVTPVIGLDYSYASNAFGYGANGGLRWDVASGEHVGFSLIADFGVRWYSGTDAMGQAVSGLTYPLELTAELVYR